MTEKMNQLMKDVPAIRWTALILLASAMFFGYIFMDILSPLQELLQTSRGWSPDAYGHYAGSETFLNVFVFFLIFAGIILDKMGVRFTAILSGAVMLAGASINYFAVSNAFIGSGAESLMNRFMNLPLEWWNITPFYEGMPASAKMSAIGFMFFGCGVEMAIARVGVAVVVLGSPVLANKISPIDVSRPVLVAVILLAIGLICFITYAFMDKKLERQMGESGEEKDDPFKLKDLKLIFSSKVFWLVALLCVLYYSAIFPFQKYAINMLQCNLGYTAEQAGWVFFVFPLGAAAITPILGNFLDHRGKGATMLIFGALLMIACHLVFALVLPTLKGTTAAVIVAYLSIILLGISFSLVPASLWPSVPKLVDNKLLGSAYAVIFWIQNIGLYAFPMIIGAALRISNPGITDPLQYNYTTPMLIFASLGVLALLFGLWLKVEDKKRGYGLELPNIQK